MFQNTAILVRSHTIVDLNPRNGSLSFDDIFASYTSFDSKWIVKPHIHANFHRHVTFTRNVYRPESESPFCGLQILHFLSSSYGVSHDLNTFHDHFSNSLVYLSQVYCSYGDEIEPCLLVLIPENRYLTLGPHISAGGRTEHLTGPFLEFEGDFFLSLCLNEYMSLEKDHFHADIGPMEGMKISADCGTYPSRFLDPTEHFKAIISCFIPSFDFSNPFVYFDSFYRKHENYKKNIKYIEIYQKYFFFSFERILSCDYDRDRNIVDIQFWGSVASKVSSHHIKPLHPDPIVRSDINIKAICKVMDRPREKLTEKAINPFMCEIVNYTNRDEHIDHIDVVPAFPGITLDIKAQAGFFNSITSLMPSMTSMASNTVDSMVAPYIQKLNELSVNASDFFQRIVTALACGYIAFSLVKWIFYKDSSEVTRVLIVSTAIGAFFPDEVKDLFNKIKEMVSAPIAQSPLEIPWDSIISVLSMGVAFFAGFDLKKFRFKPKEIIASIGSLPRFDKGIHFIKDTLCNLIDSITNFVREYFYELHPYVKDSGVDHVDKFLTIARPFIEGAWDKTPPYNMADFETIMRLQSWCSQLLMTKSFGDPSQDASVRKILTSVFAMLDKIRRPYDSSGLRAKYSRCEPVVILLSGPPGQGKSIMGLNIAKMLACHFIKGAKENIGTNEADYIYTRAPETVYWDGYSGQPVTFLDDLGQSTDVAGQPDSEYMNFIRMVNTFQSPLHMAELSQKANTFFQSRFVVVTTNHTNFQTIKSINFKEAFCRRFDYVLEVSVDEQVIMDYNKLRDLIVKKNQFFNFTYECEEEGKVLVQNTEGFRSAWKEHFGNEDKIEYAFAREDSSGRLMLDITKLGLDSINFIHKSGLGEKSTVHAVYKIDQLMDLIIKGSQRKMKNYEESLKFSNNLIDLVYETAPKDFDIDVCSDELSEVSDCQSEETDASTFDVFKECFHDSFHHLFNDEEETSREAKLFWDYAYTPSSGMFSEIAAMYMDTFSLPMRMAKLYSKFRSRIQSMSKDTTTYMEEFLKKKFDIKIILDKIKVSSSNLFSSIKKTILQVLQDYPGLTYLGIVGVCVRVYFLIFGDTEKPSATSDPKELSKEHSPPPPVVQSGDAVRPGNDVEVRRYTRSADGRFQTTRPWIPSAQSPDELILHQVITKVRNKNMFVIKQSGSDQIWANAVVIRGSLAIIPAHYFVVARRMIENNPEDALQELEFISSTHVFKRTTLEAFVESEHKILENSDIAMFLIPGSLKTFPDISKHFISNEDIPKKYIDVVLMCRKASGETLAHVTEVAFSDENLPYTDSSGHKYEVKRYGQYVAETCPGDCGSMVFASNLSFYPQPILGFHIAGAHDQYGFCNIITTELLQELIDSFDPLHGNSPPIKEFKYYKETNKDFVHDKFNTACATTLPLGISTSTNLRPTDGIFGIFGECPSVPAVLGPYMEGDERVVPLTQATLKYLQTAPHIPEKLLEVVTDDLIEDILESSSPYIHRDLTFKQAVAGIPGVKFIDGLSRKTSAGYPFAKEHPGSRGKQGIFGKIGEYDFDSQEAKDIEAKVEAILENARHKKRMIHIYGDFLKDELRPKHKAKRPRLVSCAPVEYTIAFRKVLLPVHAWFMNNRVSNGFAVGVNPFNEWGTIIEYLQTDNTHSYIAGDFSGFDTRISSVFEKYVAKVYKAVLKTQIEKDPGLANVIDVLFMDIFSSVHIVNDQIYYWVCGQPSGNPATTFVNCIVNQLLIRMCWISINGRRLDSIKDFRKCVRAIVYGDDNVISVIEEAKERFNPSSVAEAMLEFNMVYTSESKEGIAPRFRAYWEITFLKRHFSYDPDLKTFIAPLDIDTVTFMLYYHLKSKDYKYNIQMTYEAFLDELSLHYEEIWDEYYGKVHPIMRHKYDYTARISIHRARRLKTLGNKLVY